MRILFFGAGVIGSVYAAGLQRAGHDVVVLARGSRLESIRQDGLLLQNAATQLRTSTRVAVVSGLADDDVYDLVVVPVRFDQLTSALEALSAWRATSSILFFGNNPLGADRLIAAVGQQRVLLGFPGAGGQHDGTLVRYLVIRQQPTSFGELDGTRTKRIVDISHAFHAAGFSVALCGDMQSWLKTHAAFITLVAAAIYAADEDLTKLAATPDLLRLMVRSVRESFRSLAAIGFREVPFNRRLLHGYMPDWFAVRYWRHQFSGALGQFSLAAHAISARSEMTILAAEIHKLLMTSPSTTRSTDELYRRARLQNTDSMANDPSQTRAPVATGGP
jgi:2-dehydropantoate 2-reductase